MASTLTNYKIFIASPGGLEEERICFKELAFDYNLEEANPRGCHITPSGWEDTLGGVGRPQEIINRELEQCDFMVLVLHDRWGSRPHRSPEYRYSSGTEEEFYVALNALKDSNLPMKDIVVFFKAVNDRQLSDPGSELIKVLEFKRYLESEKTIMYDTYENSRAFEKKLRRYFGNWIRIKNQSIFRAVNNNISFDIESQPAIKLGESSSSDDEILEKAEAYFAENKFVNAELLFSQIAVRGTSVYGLARYGRFLYKIGQPERAVTILLKTISACEHQNNRQVEAYAYQLLGSAYNKTRNLDESINAFEKSISLYKSVYNNVGQAESYLRLGTIYIDQGAFDKAISNLNEAYTLFEQVNEVKGMAIILNYTGLVYKHKGEFESAIAFYEKSLQMHIQNKDAFNQAMTLSNLGVSYRSLGKTRKAKELHEKCLEMMIQMDNHAGVPREYTNLGIIYFNEGEYGDAEKLFIKAYDLNEKAGLLYATIYQLAFLSRIHAIKLNFDAALEFANKYQNLSEKFNLKDSLAISPLIFGEIYFMMKNFELSIIYLNNCLQVSSNSPHRLGKVYYYLSKIYEQISDHTKSELYKEKYISIFKESRPDILERMLRSENMLGVLI